MEGVYIGFFYIAIGLAVKFFPGLLAGYNSLSNREKENAQANGLPVFASILFGAMGVISIAGYFASIWLSMPSISNLFILVTIVGLIVLLVFGNLLINNRAR